MRRLLFLGWLLALAAVLAALGAEGSCCFHCAYGGRLARPRTIGSVRDPAYVTQQQDSTALSEFPYLTPAGAANV